MTLRFHKRIYSRKALLETIEAFRGVADATLSTDGDHYVLEVPVPDPAEADEIGGEMMNWALGRTIEQRGES
ncbi:MAG TPA: HxsD-like protein [Myxococcota bacterium]|nr:HxsD-like protein [Myxococcota bacterium]HQK51049.1 HxsD-like protein [Myxococcota bacterium]